MYSSFQRNKLPSFLAIHWPIFVLILVAFFSCHSNEDRLEQVTYPDLEVFESYLASKKIEPAIVFINNNQNRAELLSHVVSWKSNEKGIDILIDEDSVFSFGGNHVSSRGNSVLQSEFIINTVREIKLYPSEGLIGMVLGQENCVGLGCGVNCQVVYDLNTKSVTFFEPNRSGNEFELYHFNKDSVPDYLAVNLFCEVHPRVVDTIEYVMFSRFVDGQFKMFNTEEQEKYEVKHIFHREYTPDTVILVREEWVEDWLENIMTQNSFQRQ